MSFAIHLQHTTKTKAQAKKRSKCIILTLNDKHNGCSSQQSSCRHSCRLQYSLGVFGFWRCDSEQSGGDSTQMPRGRQHKSMNEIIKNEDWVCAYVWVLLIYETPERQNYTNAKRNRQTTIRRTDWAVWCSTNYCDFPQRPRCLRRTRNTKKRKNEQTNKQKSTINQTNERHDKTYRLSNLV